MAVLAALVAGGLTGCSSNSRPPFGIISGVSPGGQPESVLVPRGTVKGIVLFSHGLGANQNVMLSDPQLFPLRTALLGAGYVVATSEAHGDNAGNPASIEDDLQLLQQCHTRWPHTSAVDLLAFSMGGIDTLLLASSHLVTGLHAVVVLSGVTDQVPFIGKKAFAPIIRRAYGNLSGAALTAAVKADDPADRPAATFRGYRYQFWQSAADEVVPPTQDLDMVRYLRSAGIAVTDHSLGGPHGDLAALSTREVTAFLAAGGPRK